MLQWQNLLFPLTDYKLCDAYKIIMMTIIMSWCLEKKIPPSQRMRREKAF